MNRSLFEPLEHAVVEEVISRHGAGTGSLLTVLEALQERHPNNYLPKPTLDQVAEEMHVPASRVAGVVTFYSLFNLEPQGRHTVMLCRGTACHTRGSQKLLTDLNAMVGRDPDDESETYTTPDGWLTVRTVACFGQCALAPVVAVDGRIYSRVTKPDLEKILENIRK